MYDLSNVTKRYQKGGRTVTALHGLNLVIGDGEWLAVQGRTGHGKTTLLPRPARHLHRRHLHSRSSKVARQPTPPRPSLQRSPGEAIGNDREPPLCMEIGLL
jgi:ABC-type nitrate/sulfonate/bicarbonate transport system ATPase subunit